MGHPAGLFSRIWGIRLWDIGEHREAELGTGQKDQEKLLALEVSMWLLKAETLLGVGGSWVSILTEWESSKRQKLSDSQAFNLVRAI